MKKVLTIVGARPQFVKASVVSKAIMEFGNMTEVIVHTGQHFDKNMSDIFFSQLGIPPARYQMDINGGAHGEMTGRMLVEIEKILMQEKPDCVMVYGDTNSTLAGALAAAKLSIPVAHVEAGLRSFDMRMPEEVNRILTDRTSNILFCPTQVAVNNLKNEGYPYVMADGNQQHVVKVGDVMQDSAILFGSQAIAPRGLDLKKGYILATIHRAENTDDLNRLVSILDALNNLTETAPVILPLHPRTKKIIFNQGLNTDKIKLMDPVSYLEMLWLLQRCELVVTDSGGVQKEAFFMGKYCVTMRERTEWTELVDAGVNELVGADKEKIVYAVQRNFGCSVSDNEALYGGGRAAQNIVQVLIES